MKDIRLDSNQLELLLEKVDSGELKLPSFQRSYKWKPSKVKKLLDSIQKNHPAGSLLFLEVDPRKNKIILDEPFKYAEFATYDAEFLVLDGQQRLTSCYCVFYDKGNKRYFLNLMNLYNEIRASNSADDIDFESLIEVKNRDFFPDASLKNHLLPFSFLKTKDVMREKLKSYKDNLRTEKYNSDFIDFIDLKLEKFLDPFFDYIFPIVVLPRKLSLDAVCKVFQTINTTGLKLSPFDICVAKFMVDNIDLKQKIKESIELYSNLSLIIKKDETMVLQVIALLQNKIPKKSKLAVDLNRNDIQLWGKAIEGLSGAVDLLTEFGGGCENDDTLIPYQPFIPVIAAVLIDRDFSAKNVAEKSNISCKLKKWFYAASLTLRYTEGTDNKMKEDFKSIKNWIIHGTEISYINEDIRWNPNTIIKLNKNGAIGKAVLCLLNSNKPSDFYAEKQVGVGMSCIESQLHHIFPYAQYYKKYKELINSVFNFTFLSTESNNYIKSKRTLDYILGIKEERDISESGLKSILDRHFIDEISYEYFIKEEYEDFLKSRADNVRRYLVDAIGLNISINNSENADQMNIDDDLELSEDENDN